MVFFGGTKTTTPNTSKPTSPNPHFFNLSTADAVHLSGEGKRDRTCFSRPVRTTKTTLKPRTRPPQFLNHSPFGWSWTHMPWQQPVSTSPSNPDQTDLSLSLSNPYQSHQTKISRPEREKVWAESVAVWFEIRKKYLSALMFWCNVRGFLFWTYLCLILCWRLIDVFGFWIFWVCVQLVLNLYYFWLLFLFFSFILFS